MEKNSHVNKAKEEDSVYPKLIGDYYDQKKPPKNDQKLPNDPDALFIAKTANQWIEGAKTKPIPKMLFGEFWFQNELSILFADTNQGKSILAVQIANSISKGERILGLQLGVQKQKVLYFDLELTDKQFESRYSEQDATKDCFLNHYCFDDNFVRVEINPSGFISDSQTYEEFLMGEIENQIESSGTKVVIIDNLTYLISDNEKAKDTAPFLRRFHILIKKYNCSILLLTHTPKRSSHTPITRNDILGSKSFSNFIDSAFAIGESQRDSSIKYLKQIKVRAKGFDYDAENVIVCILNKPTNFTRFEFLEFGNEADHIKQLTNKDTKEKYDLASKLRGDGCSNCEIARQLGVSEAAVRKWFKKFDSTD